MLGFLYVVPIQKISHYSKGIQEKQMQNINFQLSIFNFQFNVLPLYLYSNVLYRLDILQIALS